MVEFNILDQYIERELSWIDSTYVGIIGKHVDYLQEKFKNKKVYVESHVIPTPDADAIFSKEMAKELLKAVGAKVVKTEDEADVTYETDKHPGLKNIKNYIGVDHHGDYLYYDGKSCIIHEAPCVTKVLEVGILHLLKKHDTKHIQNKEQKIRELQKIRYKGIVAGVQDNPNGYAEGLTDDVKEIYSDLKKTGDLISLLVKKNKSEEYILDIMNVIAEISLNTGTPYEEFENVLEKLQTSDPEAKEELLGYYKAAQNIRDNIKNICDSVSGNEYVCIVWEGAENSNDLGQMSSAVQVHSKTKETFIFSGINGKNVLSERGELEKQDFYKIIGQGEGEGGGGNKGRFGGVMQKDISIAVEKLKERGYKIFLAKGDIEKEVNIEEYNI